MENTPSTSMSSIKEALSREEELALTALSGLSHEEVFALKMRLLETKVALDALRKVVHERINIEKHIS